MKLAILAVGEEFGCGTDRIGSIGNVKKLIVVGLFDHCFVDDILDRIYSLRCIGILSFIIEDRFVDIGSITAVTALMEVTENVEQEVLILGILGFVNRTETEEARVDAIAIVLLDVERLLDILRGDIEMFTIIDDLKKAILANINLKCVVFDLMDALDDIFDMSIK